MNRHQKKVLSLAAAIGNLALSMSVAGVATYAWFTSNKDVSAEKMEIAISAPEIDMSWEILRYDDNYKAGRSFTDSSEFYLQDYDVYLTQKNKYANCILVATLNFGVDFNKNTHLAVDISCLDGHAPQYQTSCPAYTSNVCQFKTSAYSYTTSGDPVILNNAIDPDSPATRYSSASTWFADYPSQYEKFVSVVNNTPYKRSNTITVVPDLSGLSALSETTNITQIVLYIECSYNANLVDYYINSYNQLSGNYFGLTADLSNIEIRVSKEYTGSYVRVDSGSITNGEYLIVNEANKIALDGSLTDFSGKNYADIHPIKNRIRKTEVTEALQFTYDASAKTFTNEAGSVIGFNGSNIATSSSYVHSSVSVSNGAANILYSGSNYLRFNNTADVTKFNYASSSSYQNVALYKYDSSADYNVYVTSIAITTATTDTQFNRYANFRHNGLVVTATFNNGDTAIITNDCIYTIAGTVHTLQSPIAVSGSQIVTVTYIDPDNGHYSATASYNITIHDQVVTLSETIITGTAGLVGSVTASTQYFDGTPSFNWNSSDTSIAIVDGTGATARLIYMSAGSVTITCRATLGSQTAVTTCSVIVREGVPVTDISVSSPSSYVYRGNTITLTATITPSNATNQDVVWYSEKPATATVNDNGVVTGVASGSVVIHAFSDTNRNGTYDQGEIRGSYTIRVY